MFSLFPREEDFFVLFRKQAALVREGCVLLHAMMTEFDRLDERAKELKEVEHKADLVTHEIFERLNRTFITPMDREDIHRALRRMAHEIIERNEGRLSEVVVIGLQTGGAPMAEALVAALEEIDEASAP